jgi:hypothetical protein
MCSILIKEFSEKSRSKKVFLIPPPPPPLPTFSGKILLYRKIFL